LTKETVPQDLSLDFPLHGVSFSVIVRFVDIEEIVGDSLKFLFIITSHIKSLNIYKTIIENTVVKPG
jgi:hypothetical protein